MTAQAWFVDPQNLSGTANDANDGRSAQKALRTGKRLLDLLGRRYTVPRGTLVDVTFLSDMAASDRMSFEVTLDDPATAAFRLHGSLVPLFQGTVTSYTAETPSTNTKATLVATGVTSAHIGKLLYFPASGAWAIATACPSSGTLKLEPAKIYSSSDSTTITRATPANGATFIVYNKTNGYFGSLSFLAAWNVTDPPAPWPPPFVVENFDCPELVTFDGIGGAYQPTLIRQCTFADVITVASASNLFRACTFTANTGGTSNFAGTTQKPVAFSGCAFFGGDVAMSGARFGAGDHDSNAILCAWVVVDRSCRIKGQIDLSTQGFGEESGLWISQGVLAFTAADDVVYGTATGNNALVLADHASLRYPDGVQVYTTTDARQILVGGLGASTLLTPSLTSGSAASCDTWAKLLASPFNGAAYNADELCFIRTTEVVPVGPAPRISMYADVSSSISSSSGLISAWGTATSSGGLRPELITDSVIVQNAVRLDAGKTLTFPAGALDFASQSAVSFALVFRQRIYASTSDYTLLDTTNGGTTAGVQILARNNPGTVRGPQLIGRIYNGSSWIVDYTDHGPSSVYHPLLWSVGVVTITSTSLTVMLDGYVCITMTFAAVTFPAGAASAGVFGNFPSDWLALEVWAGGLTLSAAVATTARLQTRFSLPYVPTLLWSDPNLGETDPSGCTLSDNTYVALATKQPGAGFNIGAIQARTSPDGLTWTPSPGSDGSAAGMILPFTAPGGGGMFDSTITQLSNGTVLAVANQTTLIDIHTLRAANAAAVRSNTWTSETNISAGSRTLDICASDVTEDPANPGTVYLCSYSAFGSEAFWSAYQRKSTDYGATFAAPVRVLDGVALGKNLAEPGLKFVTAAAAAKYSDLTTNAFFYLVRDDAGGGMIEVTSPTGLAGSFTARTTNLVAFSAARFRFLQDGTMVALQRDVIAQYNMLYRRIGVSGGIAQYTALPVTPAVVAAFGGQNNGQYGSVCKEVTPGLPLIITATRLDVNRCDTYARFHPDWQLYGQMPIAVAPSSVPTKNPGDTVQFTATGAGNFVWSMPLNQPGCTINASTGLLTVGSGGGNVTVRCTDLNGYADVTKDVTFACNAGSSVLSDVSHLVFHFDPSVVGEVTFGGGVATSVLNENGASSALTPPSGKEPGYGTTTQNGLKTLDYSGGASIMRTTMPGSGLVAFSNFAAIFVIKTGSTVAGIQTFGGNAGAGMVMRMDGGVLKIVDYTATPTGWSFSDLAVTANTAHVVAFRRSGTTVDAWLDGVKSTVPGTLTTNPMVPGFPIGNDDPATLFGEQYRGFMGEHALWDHATIDADITTSSTNLKAKWGTA